MDFPLFVDAVLQNARRHPHKVALINAADGSALTYAELKTHVTKVRGWLAKHGVTVGDKVILAAARDFRFIHFYLALHSMGAVAVPLDPKTPPERFAYIHQRTTPKLALWPDASMPESVALPDVDGLPAKRTAPCLAQPDMLADIMFTSGTTGDPKGVLLTHGNLACAVNNIIQFVGNTADDNELCPMPLSHSFGIARLRCVLYAGGTYILEEGVTRPKHLFQTLAKYKATGLSMVGPAWTMLRKLTVGRISEFFDQLRYMELGSAPLTAQAKKELADLLPCTHVCMHYGLTEASRAAFLDFHEDEEQIETVGRASPLCEVAIFSPEGEPLAVGEEGEICVRGGMVTSGYLDPRDNEKAYFADGYFRTGDLGRLDEQGYVTLVGRLKEMINVGGEKVAPAEVEAVINTFPGVAASACVGQPDSVLGETVAALVVLEDAQKPVDFDELKKHVSASLESFKVPRTFSVITALPTTATGKVQRSALKGQLSETETPKPNLKETDPALYYAGRAVMAAPNTKQYREFYLDLLAKRGKDDEIIQSLMEALELDPQWGSGWQRLADIVADKDTSWITEEFYQEAAVPSAKVGRKIREQYVKQLIDSSALELATKALSDGLEADPEWAAGWFLLASIKNKQFYLCDAEQYTAKALVLRPDKFNYRKFYIRILRKQDNFTMIAQSVIEGLVQDPQWEYGWVVIADMLKNTPDLCSVFLSDVFYFTAGVKSGSLGRIYREQYISWLFKKNGFHTMYKALTLGLDDDPQWAWGWRILALLTIEKKDYAEAEEYARKAVELQPEDHSNKEVLRQILEWKNRAQGDWKHLSQTRRQGRKKPLLKSANHTRQRS